MISRGAAVIRVLVLVGSIGVLSGCAASTSGSATETSAAASEAPSPPTSEPSTAAADATAGDVPFDGGGQLESVEWAGALAGAEGFTEEPAQFGADHAYRNDETQCATELVQVPLDLTPGEGARAASDDGIRAMSEVLAPGSSDSIAQNIGDSRVPRSGGGIVDIRIAAAAWSDGTNAIIGSRAFPEIDSMVLLVVTCPVTANGRDEIQTLYRAGYFDLDVTDH